MIIRTRHPSVCGVGAALLVCAVAVPAAAQQRDGSSQGWDLALTGGFVMSGLTDPVYALGPVPGRPTRVVLRQTDRESTIRIGVAMFAEVYHDRLSWLAPVSFGLGLRDDGRATFYVGPALRFGAHASVVGGVAVGPVATLPAGVNEQQPVTDPNFLSNRGTRITKSWFAGVTYTFATIR